MICSVLYPHHGWYIPLMFPIHSHNLRMDSVSLGRGWFEVFALQSASRALPRGWHLSFVASGSGLVAEVRSAARWCPIVS